MFKKSLSAKLKRIFDIDKVSYDEPSESQEQEALFVLVEKSKNTIKEKKEIAFVQGKVLVFGSADKMPYGYFSKKIQEADAADTRDLFFYDAEENKGTFKGIAERSMSFIYLYENQYNPERGTMTSINLDMQVTE